MKNYIFLFLFLVGTTKTYSQQPIKSLLEQADSLSDEGLFDDAENLLIEVLSKSTSPKDSFLLYANLCGISKKCKQISKIEAYGHLSISKRFYQFSNLEPYGDALYNLSVAKFRLGEIDSTFYYAEKALKIRQEYLPAIHKKIAQNLVALGVYHSNKGNTNLSINYQEQALALALNINPPNYNSLIVSYFSLGSAYHSSNNVLKARENYDHALTYYTDSLVSNEKHKGHIFNAIGVLLETQKDYEAAEEYYNEAIKIFTIADNVFGNTTAYSNLANIYANFGDYAEAKKMHKKVISLLENSSYENELPWKYLNLGATYIQGLQYDSALVVLNKAKLLNTKVSGAENELSTVILNHCAIVYIEKNEYEKAKIELLKSIRIAKEIFGLKDHDLSESYYLLAKNYFNQNETKSGFEYLKLAEEALFSTNNLVLDFKGEIISRTLLLDIYILKEKKLWNQYTTTKNISFLNSLYLSTISSLQLSHVILDFYDHENAKLDVFTAIDENLYYGIKASKELYDLTKNQKYTEQALKFFESEKSVLLKQKYKSFTAKQNNQISDSLFIRENQLKRAISKNQNLLFFEDDQTSEYAKKLSSKVFNLKRDLDLLITELELNNPKYFAQKYKKRNFKIHDIQADVDSNEVIIEFYQHQNNIYSIGITNTETHFEHVEIENLESKINNFNTSILNSDINAFAVLSFEFYSTLIEKNLVKRTINQLTIIPSKSLSLLSFDAFITKTPESTSYDNLNYLIKTKAISYKNSLQPLYQKSVHAQKDYLGINPSFKSSELTSLSGASKEIEIIAKALDGEVLKDEDNLKQTIIEKLADYKIIHFATHAILNTENANYSSLLLGNSSLPANNLYAYEIQSSKLNADLVVLSACNTGVGKIETGEGLTSLARSFNYAGAKSVLVGLWALPDQSTSSIVNDFFKELKYHTKSVALKNAKTAYLNTADEHLANPIFWAGLIVIGENNAIDFDQTNSKLYLILLILIVGVLLLFRKKLF